jgi:hypothetical protein
MKLRDFLGDPKTLLYDGVKDLDWKIFIARLSSDYCEKVFFNFPTSGLVFYTL